MRCSCARGCCAAWLCLLVSHHWRGAACQCMAQLGCLTRERPSASFRWKEWPYGSRHCAAAGGTPSSSAAGMVVWGRRGANGSLSSLRHLYLDGNRRASLASTACGARAWAAAQSLEAPVTPSCTCRHQDRCTLLFHNSGMRTSWRPAVPSQRGGGL